MIGIRSSRSRLLRSITRPLPVPARTSLGGGGTARCCRRSARSTSPRRKSVECIQADRYYIVGTPHLRPPRCGMLYSATGERDLRVSRADMTIAFSSFGADPIATHDRRSERIAHQIVKRRFDAAIRVRLVTWLPPAWRPSNRRQLASGPLFECVSEHRSLPRY